MCRYFMKRIATRLDLLLVILVIGSLLATVAVADDLEELIYRHGRQLKRDDLRFKNYDWPPYNWSEDQVNFSTIFSGESGGMLPLLWLGEVGAGYYAGSFEIEASPQHINAKRGFTTQPVDREIAVEIQTLVTHPNYGELAELGAIKDYRLALPNKSEGLEIFSPITLVGLEGTFFSRDAINCTMSFKLPRSVVLSVSSACQNEPFIRETVERINIKRLIDKINS